MANVAFDYTNLAEVVGGIVGGDLHELRPRLEDVRRRAHNAPRALDKLLPLHRGL
ncbi:MAG: hypothetical protein LC751_00200 [Actinobacteria bacterium]|nr:hypothetical protein [Actinomycetota bacterium]